ncbi:MAG: hypothetical protein JWN04_2083, partial [Myxococcaceae bacterium]|nr:hypothetical protein [Myxococcaceae bacterium]
RDTDAGKEKSQWRSVGEGAAAGGAAVVTAVGAYLLLRGIAAASASSKAAAALTDMPVLSNKSKDWTKCLSIRNEWAEGDYEAAKSFGGVSGGK